MAALKTVESAILGQVLDPRHPEAMAIARGILTTPDMFAAFAHQCLWVLCCRRADHGGSLDVASIGLDAQTTPASVLWSEVRRLNGQSDAVPLDHSEWAQVGGYEAIMDAVTAANSHPRTPKTLVDNCKLVRDAAMSRKLVEGLTSVAERLDRNAISLGEAASEASAACFALSGGGDDHVKPTGDVLKRVRYDRAERMAGKVLGVPVPYKWLRHLIKELRLGSLNVVAAEPGCGKTTLAIDLALRVAAEGCGVLFASFEMTIEDVGAKMLSHLSGLQTDTIDGRSKMSVEQGELLETAEAEFDLLPVHITEKVQSGTQMRALMRRYKAQHPGIKLLVVDYLQISEYERQSENESLTHLCRQLTAGAKECGLSVIALSQLSKDGLRKGKNGKVVPDVNGLRGSGAIRQDAGSIILMHKKDERHRNHTEERLVAVSVAKNRFGRIGETRAVFTPAQNRFDVDMPGA